MEVQAVAKYVKRTPRKARLVADSVKGLKVGDALAYLEFSPKHAAIDVAKVIKSAAANAEHNFNLNREELVVKQLLIDEGPTMKRLRFRSRGMASQYFRRTCHITAVVEDQTVVEVKPARRRATTTTTGKPAAPKAAVRRAPKPAEKSPAKAAEKPAAKAAEKPVETPAIETTDELTTEKES
ncbi:MAG TPA: 50S ribosomal protein L22 [Candidatus Dormibacteraeota bacterium]